MIDNQGYPKLIDFGFAKVRVDGEIIDLVPKMQLDRYKTHDVEIVIDRVKVIDSEFFMNWGNVA